MKKILHFSLMLSLALSFTACDLFEDVPINCVDGTGEVVSETRVVDAWDQLIVDASADVYITRGDDFEVVISAQENVIAKIQTEVRDETLDIYLEGCVRREKTVRIDVTVPEVNSIEVRGSGDVYGQSLFDVSSLDLKIKGSGGIEFEAESQEEVNLEIDGSGDMFLSIIAPSIDAEVDGSGNLEISGKSVDQDLKISGSGDVRAFELLTNESRVNIRGSGDANVHASDQLGIEIKGSGNVYFKGNPSLSIDVDGSGEVVDAN